MNYKERHVPQNFKGHDTNRIWNIRIQILKLSIIRCVISLEITDWSSCYESKINSELNLQEMKWNCKTQLLDSFYNFCMKRFSNYNGKKQLSIVSRKTVRYIFRIWCIQGQVLQEDVVTICMLAPSNKLIWNNSLWTHQSICQELKQAASCI